MIAVSHGNVDHTRSIAIMGVRPSPMAGALWLSEEPSA